jgi:hypothetical protein
MPKATQDKSDQIGGAAMEGGGFYNRHSAMQAAGISLLLDDWEAAVRSTVLGEGPIVIADYGSSQGRNSMAPMRIAIDEFRARACAERPIQIVHTDLPSNDFAALFTALNDDPASYMAGANNVFASAIGRSYFAPILPPKSVNLAWNTWTLHWISGPVIVARDHAFPGFSQDPSVVEAVEKRQREDLTDFLKSRSYELKPGARLLSASVGRSQGTTGWNWIGDAFWGSIEDLGREGLLSREERTAMTVPVNARTEDQLRAPFGSTGHYEGLKLLKAEVLTVPDNTWATYLANGNAQQLGTSHANMVRAFSGPTIANALSGRADTAQILDQLYARLAARLAVAPQLHEGKLAVIVVEKS